MQAGVRQHGHGAGEGGADGRPGREQAQGSRPLLCYAEELLAPCMPTMGMLFLHRAHKGCAPPCSVRPGGETKIVEVVASHSDV